MQQLLLSFGCGICFIIGAIVGIFAFSCALQRDRQAIAKSMQENNKRIEDRLATQVAAMLVCVEEINRRNNSK